MISNHKKDREKDPVLLSRMIEEGKELDRFLTENGHPPRFFYAIENALERVSKYAHEDGVISKGRLNDIRYDLLGLEPL